MKIDIHVHRTEPIGLLLDSMEKHGIDRCLVCSSAVARGERVDTLADAEAVLGNVARAQNERGSEQSVYDVNRELAQALRPYGERLTGFGKVDLHGDDLARQLEGIVDLGLGGVGEIIGIHGHVERLRPVLAFCRDHAPLPVFIHTDYPVARQDLVDLLSLMREYPEAHVILGHLGGNHWMDVVRAAPDLPHCLLDLSEVVNLVPLRVAVRECPRQVAFGSDYPWDLQSVNLGRIESLGLPEAVKADVLGRNALRFMEVSTDEEN